MVVAAVGVSSTSRRETVSKGRYLIDALPELPLEPGLNRNQLLEAMKGHIIGQGSLVAIYERKPKQ